MSLSRLLPLLPLCLLLACPTSEGGDDDDAAGDDDDTPYVQPAPWADLDHRRRIEFMQEVFEPEMRALFQGFDAALFEGFKCETCHGLDMEDVEYEMPNGLEPLDGQGRPIDPSYDAERLHDFMDDEVIPLARELLERESGLNRVGCLDCHERG